MVIMLGQIFIVSLCWQLSVASYDDIIIDIRITGGEDAAENEFPYIVSVRGYNRHLCGGSILNEEFILTAAHCLYKYEDKPEAFTVQYGILKISELFPNVVPVKRIIIHEDYIDNDQQPNDIALLELDKEIAFGRKLSVDAVKLPTPFQSPQEDSKAILAGWGLDQTAGHIMMHLQKAELIIFPEYICNISDPSYDSDYHICAGVPKGGKGQCTGDSGGPLNVDGIQYGIVSWSQKPCGSPGHPGYFTKVTHYRNWIRKWAGV